jgi:PAS domain S-box-containing protein
VIEKDDGSQATDSAKLSQNEDSSVAARLARAAGIFDSVPAGILVQRADGAITYANAAADELFRYPFDSLLGRTSADPVWEMIDQDGAPVPGEDHPSMITLRTGGALRNQVRGLYAGDPDKTLWLLINTEPILSDETGEIAEVVITFLDITESRRSADQIKQHTDRMRHAATLAKVGHWHWDLATNEANFGDQLFDIFGLAKEDVPSNLEEVVNKLVVAEDIPQLQYGICRTIEEKTAISIEYRSKTPDGRIIWARALAEAAFDDDGHAVSVAGSIQAITEEKVAAEQLEASRRRLELVLDAATDGFWDWDIPSGEFFRSPRWFDMVGYSDEDLPNHISTIRSLCHPDDLPHLEATANARLAGEGGPRFESEVRFRAKDGGWLWVVARGEIVEHDDNGEPVRMVGTITNIDQRKKAEEQLRSSRNEMAVINNIAEIMLTTHGDDRYEAVLQFILETMSSRYGFFGFINEDGDLVCPAMTNGVWTEQQTANETTVFPPDQWAGLWGRSLIERRTIFANDNLHVPAGHLALRNALAAPIIHQEKLIGEITVVNKDGDFGPENVALLERLAGYLAPVLNARLESDRQHEQSLQALREKEELTRQLAQAQKMEAVGQLAGGVAHDFNNLLTVITGFAEVAADGVDDADPLQNDLNEIRRAAGRAAELTKQLLAFSRKQIIAPQVISLNDTIAKATRMLRRVIGEDVQLDFAPGQRLRRANADPGQIEQILVNLAVNARDAMPGGGWLTIATDNVDFDRETCEECGEPLHGEFVRIEVSDIGHGMTEEVRSKIFEPFFTTKEVGAGSGLGLSVVYGAVAQNNGHIWVESIPGKGATFTIVLPRVLEKVSVESPAASERPRRDGNETILLVEDEKMVRHLAEIILKRQGHHVLSAKNPGEALLLCEQHEGPIDLLVTDVVMPGMNGSQLYQRLTEIRPGLPVLFISGYPRQAITDQGLLRENTNFLPKPFSVEVLTRTIRDILDAK